MDILDYYKNKADYRADVAAVSDSRVLNLKESVSVLPPGSEVLDIGCGDMFPFNCPGFLCVFE